MLPASPPPDSSSKPNSQLASHPAVHALGRVDCSLCILAWLRGGGHLNGSGSGTGIHPRFWVVVVPGLGGSSDLGLEWEFPR